MTRYYKFIQDAFFSASTQAAIVGNAFVFNLQTQRGRFKEVDFQVPFDYIQNLINGALIKEITFLEFLELQGLPPLSQLVSPSSVAQALMADPVLRSQLVSDLATALKSDPAFLDLAKGDPGEKGDPGTDGEDGQDGSDSDPTDVAAILKADPAFLAATKGDQGDDGNPGLTGPPGPGGISFGAQMSPPLILENGDRLTQNPQFEPVPDAEIVVTTTGLTERLLVMVDAVGFSATNDRPSTISLDIEVDGIRLGGTVSGILTLSILPESPHNCSFHVTSTQLLAPGDHTVKLLFKAGIATRVGLRAHKNTNQIRMYVLRF